MMEKNKIYNIVLTKGKEGMSLFQLKNKEEFNIEGRPNEVYDVTGAGDTVISVLSVLLSINYPLKNSCIMANKAGGIIVQKFGTSTITFGKFLMDIWVTGGAGFIGSSLIKQLNNNDINDILIVDDLTNGENSQI